jgi:hypothetical protein
MSMPRDVRRALDPQRAHHVAADVHAEDVCCVLAHLGLVGGELDPACLAAPADQHLGLDHHWIAEALGRLHRLLDRLCRLAVGHLQTVAGEQLLALVLQQIHVGAGL